MGASDGLTPSLGFLSDNSNLFSVQTPPSILSGRVLDFDTVSIVRSRP